MSEITINLHDIPCGNCTVCIGRSIGAKHEQERIIKLLEAWLNDDNADFGETLALIKGEK